MSIIVIIIIMYLFKINTKNQLDKTMANSSQLDNNAYNNLFKQETQMLIANNVSNNKTRWHKGKVT